MKRTAQTPVTTAPIGAIRILRPGSTNVASEATTRVWIGDSTALLVTVVTASAKTPETKVASLFDKEVLTVSPFASVPVKVIFGIRSFSREALQ
jgi:hypothetical protein